jgi:glycerol-3-phosphate acyltransferase PlsX
VVVVEGFAGNIALKTAEGTARQISEYLRQAMQRTWIAQIGAMLAAGGFRILKEKVDPRRSNGGTFLGLNGIVVKSHGGTDAFGFASAVDLAYEMAQRGLIGRLAADLEAFHHKLDATAAGPGPVPMSSQAR